MDVSSATFVSPLLPTASPNPVQAKAAQGAAGTDATLSASTGQAGDSDANASTDPPTPVECVTYGVLGIDPPDGQTPSESCDYHAGQWAGAALKIGGIIALLA